MCPQLELSNANLSTEATVYGTRVIIECDVGYKVNHNATQQIVTCSESGQWQPIDVLCKRTVYCAHYTDSV